MFLKISFVIPVYNASRFIRRCVTSILEQDYSNIELILVNDGSSDDSASICNELSLNHNIKVIHQKNKGASTARNVGLSLATGDYVWFVDADDYLTHNCMRDLMGYIDKYNFPDVINFDYILSCQVLGKDLHSNKPSLLSGSDYLKNTEGRLYVWNRIYKTCFLKQKKLCFLDGTKNIEDFYFNIQVFLFAERVLNIGNVCYVYNDENENSTSRSRDVKNLLKLSDDSIIIHLKINALKSFLSYDKRAIIDRILSKSCAGFFYSLLVYKYDLKYIKKVFLVYKLNGLYPIRFMDEFKTNVFIFVVNMKCLYLIICRLYRKIC